MDEAQMSAEDMARIWERVFPASPHREREEEYSAAKEAERLRGFIKNARQNALNYAFIAQKLRGKPEEQTMRRMSSDENRSAKLLGTEYFMLAGDTYTPKVSPDMRGGILSSLRRMYLAEAENEEKLRRASQSARFGQLAAVYREVANAEKRHAVQLRAMIGRLMA